MVWRVSRNGPPTTVLAKVSPAMTSRNTCTPPRAPHLQRASTCRASSSRNQTPRRPRHRARLSRHRTPRHSVSAHLRPTSPLSMSQIRILWTRGLIADLVRSRSVCRHSPSVATAGGLCTTPFRDVSYLSLRRRIGDVGSRLTLVAATTTRGTSRLMTGGTSNRHTTQSWCPPRSAGTIRTGAVRRQLYRTWSFRVLWKETS